MSIIVNDIEGLCGVYALVDSIRHHPDLSQNRIVQMMGDRTMAVILHAHIAEAARESARVSGNATPNTAYFRVDELHAGLNSFVTRVLRERPLTLRVFRRDDGGRWGSHVYHGRGAPGQHELWIRHMGDMDRGTWRGIRGPGIEGSSSSAEFCEDKREGLAPSATPSSLQPGKAPSM